VVTRRSGSARSTEGAPLNTLSWLPDGEPRALIVLAHGYAEHSGRYDRLAVALAERGLAVHALDFAGHGGSAGRRGFVRSFAGLVADLSAFVRDRRERAPTLRCGLFGHSVGGEASAALCADEPDAVDALVLSAPYLRHGVPVSAAKLRLIRLLAKVLPRLGLERIDARRLSRLPAQVRAYLDDPLVFTRRTEAYTVAQLFAGFETLRRASRIVVPLLILHGTEDRIADPRASRELSELVSSTDVTLELVAGGYHELLNDLGRERIVERVVDWFLPRLVG
jgi:alpha-beta hydrolase superfamily lysophospholipase